MEKYKVTKSTNILKSNPKGKPDTFGDPSDDIIGRLEMGDIIDVVRVSAGGRGIIANPYLFLSNGGYISGYDAEPLKDGDEKSQQTEGVKESKKDDTLKKWGIIVGLTALIWYVIYKIEKNG